MTLTPRERQVVREIAAGARNAEIARSLGLALGTVKCHVCKALNRTGARNRAELAAMISRWIEHEASD